MARLQARPFATPDEIRATRHGKIAILDLEDRGSHELKGLSGVWSLYALGG